MKPNTPEFTYNFALTFTAALSEGEQKFIEQIIGYASRTILRMPNGEKPEFDWLWNGQAVVVDIDTTKSNSDDVGAYFLKFWDTLDEFMVNGSPVRKTQGNSRLIPPIGLDAEITNIFSDNEGEDLEVLVDIALEASGAQIPFKPESSNPNDVFGVPPSVPAPKTLTINIPNGCKSVTVIYDFI